MRYGVVLSCIVILIGLLGGCGGKQSASGPYNQPNAKQQTNPHNEKLNQLITQETFAEHAATDYIIGPGDLLDIQVLEAPDLNTEARVTAQNSISFPLLGKIDVAGLTSVGAEERVASLLSEKYMHDPHVVIAIKEYRSQRVAVIGSVNNPGTYELLSKGTLLDALALAGGLAEDASETAFVTRKHRDGTESAVEIDLDALLEEGQTQLNVAVHMGDVVFVPEAGVVYVDGAVVTPGKFPIQEDMTVSQAVTAAGGLNKVAKGSDVRLVRNINGAVQVTPVDLKEIQEGTQTDILLEDQDYVVVGKSAFKSFFDAIKLGLFFPPFSVGVQ